MRIALIGYGKMGKRIEELAPQLGHQIAYRIGQTNSNELSHIQDADVAIEFTKPEAAIGNYMRLFDIGIPVVSGTTGWNSRLPEVEAMARIKLAVFFYASNFSIGVQMALATSNYLAQLMSRFGNYTALIEEWHHVSKKDAPSGTAITFAEGIIKNYPDYNGWQHMEPQDSPGAEVPSELLPIHAFRENKIPGTHHISWVNEVDSISLQHIAKSRDGFALGALAAAEFAVKAQPGIYTMNDLMKQPI